MSRATVAKKPGTPGRSRSKPSTHRAGNAGDVRRTCGDLLACFLHCTQGCGCDELPAFPAPSQFLRVGSLQSPGAIRAAATRRRVWLAFSLVAFRHSAL